MKKVRLIVFGALCAGLATNLLAQEVFTRPVSVVPTVEPASNESESSIESVILSSIVQALLNEGFIARTEESGPRPEGDYYITAIYEAAGTAIGLEISAFKRRQGSAIASASWQGELDMTMDVAIQELMQNEILPKFPRSINVTRSDVDDAASEGEEWALALIAEIAVEDFVPQRYRPWRVDTGVHFLAFIGHNSEIYNIFSSQSPGRGVGARVSAGYAFKFGQFELLPAFVTGFQFLNYFGIPPLESELRVLNAGGQLSDASSKKFTRGKDFIIPIAAEFKAAYLGINKVQPYFRVAVGGAWHKRITDTEVTLSDGSPYNGFNEFRLLLQTGLGAEYQFLQHLWGYADVSAQFLLAGGSDNIIYLTPGLGVTLRY